LDQNINRTSRNNKRNAKKLFHYKTTTYKTQNETQKIQTK